MKIRMKKTTGASLATLLAAVLLVAASPALATTVTECHTAIGVVRGDLAGVLIGGNNPTLTRDGLNSKLTGADLKLDQGKFSDALSKLTDFQSKIQSLQSQGKISDGATAVSELLTDTQAAIDCVNNLIKGL